MIKKIQLPSHKNAEEYLLESDNYVDDERLLQDDTIHPTGKADVTLDMKKVEKPKGVHPNRPWLDKYTFEKGVKHPHNRINTRVSLPALLERIGRERVPPTIRKVMRARNQACPTWLTNYEAMARTLWMHACAGQPFAVAFIAERTEGKVAQQMKIEAATSACKDMVELTEAQLLEIVATGNPPTQESKTEVPSTHLPPSEAV